MDFNTFEVIFDRIQSDPFAAPSRIRLRIAQSRTGIPPSLYDSKPRYHHPSGFPLSSACRTVALHRNVGAADYLARCLSRAIYHHGKMASGSSQGWHGPKGGDFGIDRLGQEILPRNCVLVGKDSVEARLSVSLPARGSHIREKKMNAGLSR